MLSESYANMSVVFFTAQRGEGIGLKRHPHTEVKHNKIFMPVTIPVRVKGKINPGRAHRQLVLEAEPHPGTEILEILAEGVRHNIGLAVVGVLTLLIAAPVWRYIAEVEKKGSGQISNQSLPQLYIDDIVCQPADRIAVCILGTEFGLFKAADRIFTAIEKSLGDGQIIICPLNDQTSPIAHSQNSGFCQREEIAHTARQTRELNIASQKRIGIFGGKKASLPSEREKKVTTAVVGCLGLEAGVVVVDRCIHIFDIRIDIRDVRHAEAIPTGRLHPIG